MKKIIAAMLALTFALSFAGCGAEKKQSEATSTTETTATTAATEQTEFDIVLKSAGANKIDVIKVVREITGLGLKEAKTVVDDAPKTLKEAVSKDEAEAMKAKLEEAGAEIEIK